MRILISLLDLAIVFGVVVPSSVGQCVVTTSTVEIQDQYLLVKYVNDSLSLTCSSFLEHNQNLTWSVPSHPRDRASFIKGQNGNLTIALQQLTENDAGTYKCSGCSKESGQKDSTGEINLVVKRKTCSGVLCAGTNICIVERYVCDGFRDCPSNEDESELRCGQDPCAGKIRCPDKRCIPESWCCINNENCTKKWDVDCCPNNVKTSTYWGSPEHYKDHVKLINDKAVATSSHAENDENTRWSMFFRVILGCCFLFSVVGAVLVLTACQVLIYRQWDRMSWIQHIQSIRSHCFRPHLDCLDEIHVPRAQMPVSYINDRNWYEMAEGINPLDDMDDYDNRNFSPMNGMLTFDAGIPRPPVYKELFCDYQCMQYPLFPSPSNSYIGDPASLETPITHDSISEE